MIDGMFIGRYVGERGLAGVNIVVPCINFTFAIGIMIAVESSTMIAIYFGNGDLITGNRVFIISVLIMGLLGFMLSFLIYTNIDVIINFLGANSEIFIYAKEYLSIIILFYV